MHLLKLSVDDRRAGLFLVSLHLCTALIPAATALATGWLVSSLIAGASGEQPTTTVLWPLVTIAALLVVDEALTALAGAVEQYAAGRVDARIRHRVRELALSGGDLARLENESFANDVARASDVGEGRMRSPGAAAVGQLKLVFRMLAAFASAGVVAVKFSPVLAVVLLAACLAMRALLRRWFVYLADVRDGREAMRRRAEYWTDMASTGPAAKEIRLFGLQDWVVRRRTSEHLAWAGRIQSTHRRILRKQWWTAALAGLAAFAALLFPALAAVKGTLPASDLMAVIVAAWKLFAIGSMGLEAFDIEYGLGAVRALNRLNRDYGGTATAAPTRCGPSKGGAPPALRCEGLAFRYPGTDRRILDGLHMAVRPGEVLAIVGRNGVGKTTLIKLIAGLCTPTQGRLLVDGRTLEAGDLVNWRRRVAVVFQDFNHYPLSVADNIALAAPEHRSDLVGIRLAAQQAGADAFIEQMPDGYGTWLGQGPAGGTDLSGGQWQRIALARALFAVGHGRDVLILDEPTAHLDIEAEARFHQQIIASVKGATVLLISHRLSTVRHADRIMLLDAGIVTEEGSHEELIARGGSYARMFHLQAERFTVTTAHGTGDAAMWAETER